MTGCHCGRTLSPEHFGAGDDLFEQHAIRCCACVDSYLCGADDCAECNAAGEEDQKPELVSTISGPISELERFEFSNVTARVHPAKLCEGTLCSIHNPSEHRMREWPMLLRETALIERTCEHGVGHPDPDSAAFMDRRFGPGWGTHGCDGCCHD